MIVEQGLNEGDEIYISIPENADKLKYSGEELISVIKEREAKKKLEEANREERSMNSHKKSRSPNGKGRRSGSSK